MKYAARKASLLIPVLLGLCGCSQSRSEPARAGVAPPHLAARSFHSGTTASSHTYNGISAASDGRIYYVLSSNALERGGQMYSYDPASDKIDHIADLTEAAGEKDRKAIPQGKSHVAFQEFRGKLYFATHAGYYNLRNGREQMAIPPPSGYAIYPGGHFLAYDLAARKFESIAKAPEGQGILSMVMDTRRGRIYGVTWPNGNFLRYDLSSRNLKNLGPISREGEAGTGITYRALCRSLVVNPDDGSVYFTTSDGDIARYRYDQDAIAPVPGEDMRKDYFGTYHPNTPGHMGYNWRQAFWYEPEKAIYAVHGNSGYLFRFDPGKTQVDVIDRITSEPSRRSGMFDKFYYGYLGFTLGPDGQTLYYLTGGPMIVNGKRVIAHSVNQLGAKGEEDLHLVTFHIPSATYRDHGAIFLPGGRRPSYVNSIAIGRDGSIYTLANMTENGVTRTDLVRISKPVP